MFHCVACAALLAIPVAGTAAQRDAVLEEVVVSGFRVKTPMQLDASISLFDGEVLQLATIEHFEELVPLVPNMNFSGEGSRARYFQLRGIGEREQYEGAPNPSVGFIIDDIDLSGIGGVSSLHDLQQVEVLRGPQSMRYGASALAGVVYLRSREPSAETDAHAELSGGSDGLFSAAAAAGGPIASQLSGRISVSQYRSDGFRSNTYLGIEDSNGRDEFTARGKLRWLPADGWEALLTLLATDYDNGYDAWAVDNGETTYTDHPGHDEQQTRAASLRVSGALAGGAELVSITGWADSDILFSFDGDWGNPDFWQGYGGYIYDYRYDNPRQRSSHSQELRLQPPAAGRGTGALLDWVLGAYWQELGEDNAITSTGLYDDRAAESYCAPCLTDRRIRSDYSADTLALFGGMDFALSERLELSLGLRHERWDARYADDWRDINYPGVPPAGDSCSQFDCTPDASLWGGHATLSRDWREGLRAYARIARGFKAGGFNPSLAALQGVALLGPEFIAYGPEYAWNYELGLKGRSADGRLEANLALFWMEREHAQLSQSSQQVAFDPNSFVYVTYNGEAWSRGLEAALDWQASPAWRLSAALGLLDSEIGEGGKTPVVSPGAVNRELAHAPPYTFSLGATFTAGNGWFGRIDFSGAGAFYFDISHGERSRAYQLLNLRAGRQWGSWSLSAWVRNLTDEDYSTRGFYFGNEPPAFEPKLYTRFGDPRSIGATLAYEH